MTPENTLGGDGSTPATEPMPDPVIDPTAPETPAANPDPVIDPTAPTEPVPAPVAAPVVPNDSQTFGDDPTESLDPTAAPEKAAAAPTASKQKNTKMIITIAIIAVAALVLIILAIILLPKLFSSVDTEKHEDNAFFVEEKNGSDSFAIFTRDGKQVTDFIYSNVSGFINGHAVACNRENVNKCGIVTSAGTTSLEFGAYDSISNVGGLYIAARGGSRLLINYAGKQIAELASSEDANAEQFVREADSPFVIYNYGDNKYKLYNGEGDELAAFESTAKPTLFHSDQVSVTFASTGDKIYAMDSEKQTIISETDAKSVFSSIKDTSSNNQALILQTSAQKDTKHQYAIYANSKVTLINSDECSDLFFAEDTNGKKMNYVLCKIGYGKYPVDENGYITHEDSYSIHRINADTYAKKEYHSAIESKDGYSGYTIDFYKDGKKVKSLQREDLSLGAYCANGYYVFYSSDYDSKDRNRIFYVFDTNGEEVFKYEFEQGNFGNSVYGPDSNGNYLITEIKRNEKGNTEYYYRVEKPDGTVLIGDQQKRIKEFHGFYLLSGYWIEAVIDKNGQAISPEEQKYEEVTLIGKNFISASNKSNGVTDIYSLSGKKITGESKNANASAYKNYATIKEGSNYKYYNVDTGELIYAQ